MANVYMTLHATLCLSVLGIMSIYAMYKHKIVCSESVHVPEVACWPVVCVASVGVHA